MAQPEFHSPIATWPLFLKLGGIVPVFIAGIWSVSLILSIFVFVQERQTSGHMLPATATVLAHVVTQEEEFNSDLLRDTHHLDLEFSIGAGRDIRLLYRVGGPIYDNTQDGDSLPIWYFEDNPTIIALSENEFSAGALALLVVNLCFLIVILLTALAPIIRTRSALRARRTGDWHKAKVTGTKKARLPSNDGPRARLLWRDTSGAKGRSMVHLKSDLSAFPKGRDIQIARDGNRSWWIKDIGQEF